MENLFVIVGFFADLIAVVTIIGLVVTKIRKHCYGLQVGSFVSWDKIYIPCPVKFCGKQTEALWNSQGGGNYGVVPFGSSFLVCSGLGPNNPDVTAEREFDSIESAVQWIERKRKKGA